MKRSRCLWCRKHTVDFVYLNKPAWACLVTSRSLCVFSDETFLGVMCFWALGTTARRCSSLIHPSSACSLSAALFSNSLFVWKASIIFVSPKTPDHSSVCVHAAAPTFFCCADNRNQPRVVFRMFAHMWILWGEIKRRNAVGKHQLKTTELVQTELFEFLWNQIWSGKKNTDPKNWTSLKKADQPRS